MLISWGAEAIQKWCFDRVWFIICSYGVVVDVHIADILESKRLLRVIFLRCIIEVHKCKSMISPWSRVYACLTTTRINS